MAKAMTSCVSLVEAVANFALAYPEDVVVDRAPLAPWSYTMRIDLL